MRRGREEHGELLGEVLWPLKGDTVLRWLSYDRNGKIIDWSQISAKLQPWHPCAAELTNPETLALDFVLCEVINSGTGHLSGECCHLYLKRS